MEKQRRTSFILSIAIVGIIAIVLLLLFIPDMSSTLLYTVPDTPPEPGAVDTATPENLPPVTIDRTNAKNIIAAIRRPAEYFSQTQATIYHKSGSATYSRRLWVKNNLSRIDTMAQNAQSAALHCIYSADSVYVWRPNSTSFYKTSRGEFSPDDEQMMMTYEDILNTKDDNVIVANLVTYESVPCIYTEIKREKSAYTEKYWIAYSTGLLVHGEKTDSDGNLIYSITTTHTDISPQSLELFRLPDGTYPN